MCNARHILSRVQEWWKWEVGALRVVDGGSLIIYNGRWRSGDFGDFGRWEWTNWEMGSGRWEVGVLGPLSRPSFKSLIILQFHCGWVNIYKVLGLLRGPTIAATYPSCSEVMSGQHVPGLYGVNRIGVGLSLLIGPTLCGKN